MGKQNKREAIYQRDVKRRVHDMFGVNIKYMYKSSPYAPQGWPDLTIVFKNGRNAYLEIKRDKNANKQPNQEHYVRELNKMGLFAAIVYPENEEQVMLDFMDWFVECQKVDSTVDGLVKTVFG